MIWPSSSAGFAVTCFNVYQTSLRHIPRNLSIKLTVDLVNR